MVVNDIAHVRHAAVAYFHVVLVKDQVEIVVWWEVLLDQVEEGFSDVGLDIFAAWGVKPDGVSLLDDEADILRLMAAGICLMTVGGWLDFVLM